MLPGVEAAPLGLAAGVGIVIIVNAALSEWLVRGGGLLGTAVRQFVTLLAMNIGIVAVGQLVIRFLSGPALEHALIFVLLLTLIVTLYDRYRPVHLARFGGGSEG